jgi:hypothetical protein
MTQLELPFYAGERVNIDGINQKVVVGPREVWVRYLGYANRQPNGKYHVLADVEGSLCLVEIGIRMERDEEARHADAVASGA